MASKGSLVCTCFLRFTTIGDPFFRGSGLRSKLLGDWHLSGFAILEKGVPLTVSTMALYSMGGFNGDGSAGDRPNVPASTLQTKDFRRSNYLTAVFPASAFPRPALGTDGNLGRNLYRGPGFVQTDTWLAKTFKVTERLSAHLQVDAFNAFNRVNLTDPVMDLSSINFGKSTSMNTPWLYQLGLRVEF